MLENKLGITSQVELAKKEEKITKIKLGIHDEYEM